VADYLEFTDDTSFFITIEMNLNDHAFVGDKKAECSLLKLPGQRKEDRPGVNSNIQIS